MKGLGTHWEMWALSLGGMENHAVLRAATLTGAEKLGIDQDVGSLEPGKLADFIVIDGDPLERLRDTVKISAVTRGGFQAKLPRVILLAINSARPSVVPRYDAQLSAVSFRSRFDQLK